MFYFISLKNTDAAVHELQLGCYGFAFKVTCHHLAVKFPLLLEGIMQLNLHVGETLLAK